MKPFACVRGIQIFYALSGYNLNLTKNIYLRILLWLILAVNLMLVYYTTVLIFKREQRKQDWQIVIIFYQTIVFWIYYHCLIFKVGNIVTMIKMLIPLLNPGDIKRCFILSLIVPAIAVATFGFCLFAINSIRDTIADPTTFEIIAYLFALNKLSWTILCDIIYTLFYYILYIAKKNKLQTIILNLEDRTFSYHSIQSDCIQILTMHKEFDDVMSFFPFLSFSNVFFSFSQALSPRVSKHNDVIQDLTNVTVIWKCFSILIVIGIVGMLSSRLSAVSWEIIKKITNDTSIDSIKRFSLISVIDQCTKEAVTGWGMFKIDSSLILSFLSSLITFTIVFTATNDSKKDCIDHVSSTTPRN